MAMSLAQVRRLVSRHEAGRGRRFPLAVRRAVVEYARSQREAGASWTAIAREVGMARYETVRRWSEASGPGTGLVPVEVVAVAPEPRPRAVSIVSPSGFRLEGLAPAEAVAALKALG